MKRQNMIPKETLALRLTPTFEISICKAQNLAAALYHHGMQALSGLAMLMAFLTLGSQSQAQHNDHTPSHEMQHGFVLSTDDKFASHLVATGHHSRQAEVTGQLNIDAKPEEEIYRERKSLSAGGSYFLFQAQVLDLPSLKDGQLLKGHIIESKIGAYEPKNTVVQKATYKIEKVLLNIPNPFFVD